MHHQKGHEGHVDSDRHYGIIAANLPSAEVLMYGHDVLGLSWCSDTLLMAALAGSIDCLSYAHACGCPRDELTCAAAAVAGNVQCLAYANEHGYEWDMDVLRIAARKGHLECLKYLNTHGCPYTAKVPHLGPVMFDRTGVPTYLTTEAVIGSSIPCLAYVHEAMGCAWDPKGSECKRAFQRGDLELLQYVHSHDGVLCTQFELLCPDSGPWLEDSSADADKKAMCLLYVLCYGGCQVKQVTK